MNNMQGMYIRKTYIKPRKKNMMDVAEKVAEKVSEGIADDKPKKRKNRKNYKKKVANQKVGKYTTAT